MGTIDSFFNQRAAQSIPLRSPMLAVVITLSTLAVGCFTTRGHQFNMPVVVPTSCATGADCRGGTCEDDEQGEAVCECLPGFARTYQYTCEPLFTDAICHGTQCEGIQGCLSTAHCDEGEVCERTTGRCHTLVELAMCVHPSNLRSGAQPIGGSCAVRETPDIPGCGGLVDADFCVQGLVCTPSGPLGMSLVCGAPARQVGVCRQLCDLCALKPAARCQSGQDCLYFEGIGGVCLDVGYAEGQCGEALCKPGETCQIGNIWGYAYGLCEVPCSGDDICPDDGTSCQPPHTEYPEITICLPDPTP